MRLYKFNLSLIFSFSLFLWAITTYSNAQDEVRSFGLEEIVVTAQKREQNINDVGMTIDVATGDALKSAGVTDTFDIGKLVSGFSANMNYYGSPIYTIRGIGFQDTALASPQTVSVSIDQMPIPFAPMASGAILDVERVEVLKGPQGTLFGMNTTGGAINYIANKPTKEFEGGFSIGAASFGEIDVSGYLSGPLSETLSARVAVRSITSDGHYYSYTENKGAGPNPMWASRDDNYTWDDEKGAKDFLNARLSLLWEPSESFTALLRIDNWSDGGDSPMPQYQASWARGPGEFPPLIQNYPVPPNDNRASDWGPCVNSKRTGNENNETGNLDVFGNPENLGNQNWNECTQNEKDNEYTAVSLRMDWDLGNNMTLTSLTSISDYDREEGLEADGTIYQNYEVHLLGEVESQFQELRLSGTFGQTGNWVIGANYESTETKDDFLASFGYATVVPYTFFTVIPFGPTVTFNNQETDTTSFFGSVDFSINDNWAVTLGARYTEQERESVMSNQDSGDGVNATFGNQIITYNQILSGQPVIGGNAVAGGSWVASQEYPFYTSEKGFARELNEDNFSWKLGTTYSGIEDALFWFNLTKGFKSGSFPTIGATTTLQYNPVVQEEILAYELGGKISMLDNRMQLNAAVFYYDYKDKQVVGSTPDPILGPLPTLINVPEAEVTGIDVSIEWYPMEGLRIAPSFTYVDSEVGQYRNWDTFAGGANSGSKNFTGQPFPHTPEIFGKIDVQYSWDLENGSTMYVGANMDYQDETTAGFVDTCQEPGVPCTSDLVDIRGNLTDLRINSRTLIDIRAGMDFGEWQAQIWGRNITDEYYWTQSQSTNDTVMRWTGMPRTYGISLSRDF
jgi:outer membrane receptor protein involved in Fe transport